MSTSLERSIDESAKLRTTMLPDPTQLELLRDPKTGDLPRSAIIHARRAGRPKGARNKRSKKVADYFVAKYGDPIDVLGNLMNTPLKTLVDVLLEADGGAEREERIFEGLDAAVAAITALRKVPGNDNAEVAGELADAIDKLTNAARQIAGKPGKLALDALALQLQATFRALEYVHGKQPISIDIAGKADLVVFAPEILKAHGIDAGDLQAAIAKRGLEAFDAENMRLLPHVEDGEFTDATDEGGDQ